MQVRVRLFARAREAYGRPDDVLDLSAPATPADCYDLLAGRSPALSRLRPSLLVAVNEEYAAWSDALRDGDEVAFIPPVSGG